MACVKSKVLVLAPLLPVTLAELERRFEVTRLWERSAHAFLSDHGALFKMACTRSSFHVSAGLLAQLSSLELLACFGVGVDAIDLAAAAAQGIQVTNTPDVLTDDVADLAIGLMLDAARMITAGDRLVRAGRWGSADPALAASVRGKRLGIVGLGRIGSAIAQRAQAFSMRVSYFSRSPKPQMPYRYVSSLPALAADSDILMVCAPGGAQTHHLIDRDVIAALGAQGILINVGRGSLVDESALIEALQNRLLRGAALDVYENEPDIRGEFLALDNLVLCPHLGSATEETRTAMGQLMIENVTAFAAGKPLPSPVPYAGSTRPSAQMP